VKSSEQQSAVCPLHFLCALSVYRRQVPAIVASVDMLLPLERSDLGDFAPSKCDVVHCSFIDTTYFGLTGHLHVYRLLWLRILLLSS
jgi:hypothetical protein